MQHSLHLAVPQIVRDGGEEVPGVPTLQVRAAAGMGDQDGLVVCQDLQSTQKQGLALSAWHHHLGMLHVAEQLAQYKQNLLAGAGLSIGVCLIWLQTPWPGSQSEQLEPQSSWRTRSTRTDRRSSQENGRRSSRGRKSTYSRE
ncbi:hypothetical protein DPEC_G00298700 [Dallia pectoralis]|uniref:Uncharacterized protein n=1 Tax=Dallia pectoralis TaxID=75939 RepID=A0ACC2FG43_DALPE|nr:hypothetical protein DPEC_G00298700 [Dallia pectoralis]